MEEHKLEYASFLEKLWYHGSTVQGEEESGKLILEIQTDDDKEDRYYYYEDVEPDHVRGLLDAYRQGSYYNNNIKGNYDYKELTENSELVAHIV